MQHKTDYASKSKDEIQDAIVQLKKEFLNLKFQKVYGQLTNPSRFRIIRREVARAKTQLRLLKI